MLTPNNEKNKIEVQIKEGSYLFIKGTSNVNTFTCNYHKPIKPQVSIFTYQDHKNGWLLDDAELSLESTSFDCGGRRINNDFKELVKSNHFPSIKIEVFEIRPKESNFKARIGVSIAGVTQTLFVSVVLENAKDNTYTSILKLNIEDFNLDAPTKMMGLIKVDEEISIHVNLCLELSVKS